MTIWESAQLAVRAKIKMEALERENGIKSITGLETRAVGVDFFNSGNPIMTLLN